MNPTAQRSALRRRIPQMLVGVLIGGLAMVWALRGVPLSTVASTLKTATLPPLLLIAVLFLFQQVIRAWRQAIIIQATQPNHTLRTSLSVLCVSFFLINTLPARIGEVSRPLLLLERDGTPLGVGVAAVVLERMLDLMATFVMLALVAWFVPGESHTISLGSATVDWVSLGQKTAAMVLPFILLGLFALFFAGGQTLRVMHAISERLPMWTRRISAPFLRFGQTFVDALSSARSPRRLASIVGLTVCTWAMTGLMYPLLAQSFGVGSLIGYGEGIGILCVTMLGMILPSAPGFAGTYEAFFRAGVGLFGVQGPELDATAIAMALTMHWGIYVVQSSSAIAFLIVDRIDLRRLMQRLLESLS